MSKYVATAVGVFRHWQSSSDQGFLFLCPVCEEWLPVRDPVLSGEQPIDHEYKRQAQFCQFSGAHPELGPTLLATMQALVLMEEKPYLALESEAIRMWKELAGKGHQ